jgi:hypothetical protein
MAVTIDKWERLHAAILGRINALDSDEARQKLDEGMSIDFDEHFAFQREQSQAHAGGILSPEVAQQVYNALGEVHTPSNGGWAKGTSTATKCLVTQLMHELLSRKVEALTT